MLYNTSTQRWFASGAKPNAKRLIAKTFQEDQNSYNKNVSKTAAWSKQKCFKKITNGVWRGATAVGGF